MLMQLDKFISKEYIVDNKIELPHHINQVNIDIGLSFNAPVSYEWLKTNPELVVFGFEPNSGNIQILKDLNKKNTPIGKSSQYKKNDIKKFIGNRFFILPFALSNFNGNATFYNIKNKINIDTKKYDYDSGSSSLLEPKTMKYFKTEVKVFRLEKFLAQFNWDKIPFIHQVKIDAQGEDFKIIYGMGKYIKKVYAISYEMNAPGYFGYKNYKFKNIKMFIYMFLKGFQFFKKTSSDIVFINKRFNISNQKIMVIGT